MAFSGKSATGNAGSLIIRKEDSVSHDLLNGATFAVYADQSAQGTAIATGTTGSGGENGILHFDNLAPGTYWIKETAAPNNYNLIADAIQVTVTAGVTNPDPVVVTDQYNPPKAVTTTNPTNWQLWLFGGLGLAVLLALLLLILLKKRKKQVA